MLNICIPMAGNGQRFKDAGYTTYKPFLPIGDKTMIERVLDNVTPSQEHHFYLITRPEYLDMTQAIFDRADVTVVSVDEVTEGAACTVLLLKEYINNDDPLLIANSDQLVDVDINDFLEEAEDSNACIMTFPSTESKWSYAVTDEGGDVTYVVEKPEMPVGEATVGIYYWKRGSHFVKSAERMIEDNFRVNNEFYVCPTFNWMPRHMNIECYRINRDQMWGLGTPSDYETYLQSHSL